MADVVIRRKKTGKVVAQVRVHLVGQNYTLNDDRLIEADAERDNFTFEIVPVSTLDAPFRSTNKNRHSEGKPRNNHEV